MVDTRIQTPYIQSSNYIYQEMQFRVSEQLIELIEIQIVTLCN
jgi:hypothetical protein